MSSSDTSDTKKAKAKSDDTTEDVGRHAPEGFEPLPGDPPVQSPPEPDQNDPAIWNPERIGEKGDESDPDGRGGRVASEEDDRRLGPDEIRDRAREKAEKHEEYGV